VKLFPALSKSGRFSTSAGTAALSIVPPPGAAAPCPTARGEAEVLGIDSCEAPQLVKRAIDRKAAPNRIEVLMLMFKGYVGMLELSSYSSNI